MKRWIVGLVAVGVVLATSLAQSEEHAPWPVDWNNWSDPALWVTVGNPGNAPDPRHTTESYGSVGYEYNIGKYEVTAGQYTAFLNAVATVSDTYGLYDSNMWSDTYGCKIEQTFSSGIYTYSVAADRANRPVNYVSWGDAARFANWLHNGQPTGAQGLSTTEDGAYHLNGDMLHAVFRKADWKFAITSGDEWYKAAYHKNDGTTGNYFRYPTSSDSEPSNALVTPDPGNNSNFSGEPTIGSPYWTTEVGAFENSESPYGTFDQGGNVWELNESGEAPDVYFGMRGGGWNNGSNSQAASGESGEPAAANQGFRMVRPPVFLAGDVDKNGRVDIFDVGVVQAYYLYSPATWDKGDFNGDGRVNIFDVAMMQVNYGYGVESAPAPVPEPSTFVLAVLGALGIAIGWWRGRKTA
ncbi:MAG: SUMF1/EgtB/PvdO family nonheme iron enzyme [Pirellulales bacterium]